MKAVLRLVSAYIFRSMMWKCFIQQFDPCHANAEVPVHDFLQVYRGKETLCNLWRIGYTLSMKFPIPHAAVVMTISKCALKTVIHNYTARLIHCKNELVICK